MAARLPTRRTSLGSLRSTSSRPPDLVGNPSSRQVAAPLRSGGGTDGELYYVTRGNLMAVPIGMNGPTLEAGTPVVLFPTPTADYAALPDGQSFLINMASDTSTPPITVVLNWKPPLRR